MLTDVLGALDTAESPVSIPPAPRLQVTRHLAALGPTGVDPAIDAILDALLRVADRLPWQQTTGYLGVLSGNYLANYGYIQLIGPAPSIIENPSVRVGIGLWGPDLRYPLHEHEARETYHVLTGEPAFGAEDGSWRMTMPGDAVYNPPWHRHALCFGSTPTALLYCWTGAVEADARLVEVP